jgi:hypothetical protein
MNAQRVAVPVRSEARMYRISDELEATSRALRAADEAHFAEPISRVRWQRSGLLQRLRSSQPAGSSAAG